MSFEVKGEAVIAAHDMNELKLVYRALHKGLRTFPELMDSHFLTELQLFLQKHARQDGVDVTHHSAWDAWLQQSGAS